MHICKDDDSNDQTGRADNESDGAQAGCSEDSSQNSMTAVH